MASRRSVAVVLLLTSVTALSSAYYSLREQTSSNCGFAHYGSTAGSAQRLVETHLSPGVADWNIVVPMPLPCAEAPVTGADMRVCDVDARPDVAMNDARSARVHRSGQLTGFATVNVTIYCILPPPPLTSIALPVRHLTDSRTTYEMLSNELISKEVEETSYESESTDLKSTELITTVKTTSSTTLSPPQKETTGRPELTPPTEMMTATPNIATRPKEIPPHSLKVTINITPTNQLSAEEDLPQSVSIELPSLPNKEKPDEVRSSLRPKFSSMPSIVTPSRLSEMPPWKKSRGPRVDSALPFTAESNWPPGAYPPPGTHWPLHYPPDPKFSAMSSPYDLLPPYSLASVYRPLSLLRPWPTFMQSRQPVLFFRHF